MKNKDLDIIFKSLVNTHLIPSDEEISPAIAGVERKLEEKAIKRAKNKPIKDGYELAIILLRERNTDLDSNSQSSAIFLRQGRVSFTITR